jgi:hypothetical protein
MRLCGKPLLDHDVTVERRLPTWHRLAPHVAAPVNNPLL